MRSLLRPATMLALFLAVPAAARAQIPATMPSAFAQEAFGPIAANGETTLGTNIYHDAPGNYGVAWGYASYGIPRTHSDFASPFGPNYSLGLGQSSYAPNAYGAGLWQSESLGTGSDPYAAYRRGYRTFAYPARPNAPQAPLGRYAPYYGPPGWYAR